MGTAARTVDPMGAPDAQLTVPMLPVVVEVRWLVLLLFDAVWTNSLDWLVPPLPWLRL